MLMHGGRKGAMALGAAVMAPLASAEAAEARPTAGDGGGPSAAATPATPASTQDPGPGTTPPPRAVTPAIAAGGEQPGQNVPLGGHPTTRRTPPAGPGPQAPPVRRHGDDRREPMVTPKPASEPVQDVPPPVEPTTRRSPPADPAPIRRYADERREPRPTPAPPAPANPTIAVAPPPIGNQVQRPPGLPASADGADRWLRDGHVPDERGQPDPAPEPAPAEPEPPAEPEAPAEPVTVKAIAGDDGRVGVSVDVDLPGEDFDFTPHVEVPTQPADVVGPQIATALNPVGGLLKLQDEARGQLPPALRPFARTPAEMLADGGNWVADQIPAGPEEPTLDDGPLALWEGFQRNSLRDGIRTLTGLPQGIAQMPRDIHTDIANGAEDLYRFATGDEPREGSEPIPGETGLQTYTRNYPFTGGFGNMGVNMYDRYYPFVAARNGNLAPLVEDMTDPETGELRAPTAVRDYYSQPSSTLLEDLAIPSLFVPFAKVPVRKPPTVTPGAPVVPRTPDVPPRTNGTTPTAPNPEALVRERLDKVIDDAPSTAGLNDATRRAGAGTDRRTRAERPERTGAVQPSETRAGATELRNLVILNDLGHVDSIRVVRGATGGQSADLLVTFRQGAGLPEGPVRFEVTTVTGAPRGYVPRGIGRAGIPTARQIRAAIDRKTKKTNQFTAQMGGAPQGGILSVGLRGKPVPVADLIEIVESRGARLGRAKVFEVWFVQTNGTVARIGRNADGSVTLIDEFPAKGREPVPAVPR